MSGSLICRKDWAGRGSGICSAECILGKTAIWASKASGYLWMETFCRYCIGRSRRSNHYRILAPASFCGSIYRYTKGNIVFRKFSFSFFNLKWLKKNHYLIQNLFKNSLLHSRKTFFYLHGISAEVFFCKTKAQRYTVSYSVFLFCCASAESKHNDLASLMINIIFLR